MDWYLTARILIAVSMVTSSTCSNEMVLEYRVAEELPVETFVGNVATDAGFDRKYPSAVFDRLRYGFLTLPNAGDLVYFSIDEQTGVIRTATAIDRETACTDNRVPASSAVGGSDDGRCLIKFDVAVRPIEYFRIVRVRVEIDDINDNGPIFVPDFLALEISESAQPGTEFALPPAEDADGPYFRVAHYDLRQVLPPHAASEAEPFSLSVRGRSGGNFQLRLVVRSPLDRETTDVYRLKVVAYDGGEPPRSGTLLIDVDIRDVNDVAPKFPGNATFVATVDENVPVGTVIATLSAADADLGPNAELSYRLSPETARDYGRLFGVRAETGELFTRAALDYETQTEYALYVTASDRRTGTGNDVTEDGGGRGSLSSQALVMVRVQDVNDNAPRIDVHVLSSSSSSSASSGPVARLRDVDTDSAWHLEIFDVLVVR